LDGGDNGQDLKKEGSMKRWSIFGVASFNILGLTVTKRSLVRKIKIGEAQAQEVAD